MSLRPCWVGGYWWAKQSNRGYGSGRIRLPDNTNRLYGADSELAQNLASVPRFVLGVASAALARVREVAADKVPFLGNRVGRSRGAYGGYRHLSTDEDAAMLPDFEEEELDR